MRATTNRLKFDDGQRCSGWPNGPENTAIMKRFLRLAAMATVVLAAVGFWTKPGYIEFSIPVVKHLGGGAFWYERQRAELAFEDTAGVLFAYRQVGTAYPDTQGWSTVEEVLAFFDRELAARGWTVAAQGGSDYILPESRLLKSEQIRQYSRPEDRYPEPRAMVAVWPIAGGVVEGFHVALVTANPSLLYRLAKGFD
jgi:hypothetical protein